VINLRAIGDPELLMAGVRKAAGAIPGAVRERYASCFRAAAPQPEHHPSKKTESFSRT
jgi:hypothetical protein